MNAHPSTSAGLPTLAGTATFEEASRLVLDYLQAQVPMGFWTVSRVVGGRQVYLDVTGNEHGLEVGDGPRWEDSLCHSMWVEGAPRIAPDISQVPEYARNDTARALSVASYVGIPLFNEDQTLFGTVCGFDTSVRGAALADLAPQLDILGQMLSVVRNLDARAVDLSRRLEATQQEADTDALTGLRNRRAWQRACEVEEARHHRLGDQASVILLDLDGLKRRNDEAGHAAGDAMLRLTADVLRGSTRLTDVVARLGGDEFGVLCPQTTEDEVGPLVDRLRSELAAAGLSAGIGAATLDQTAAMADTEALADAAMYVDKRAGRHS